MQDNMDRTQQTQEILKKYNLSGYTPVSNRSIGGSDVDSRLAEIDAVASGKQTPVVKTPQQTSKEKAQKDLGNAASFLGLKPLAQGVGQAIAQPQNAQALGQAQNQATDIQTQLLQRIKQGKDAGADTKRLEDALAVITENIGTIGNEAGKVLNPNDLTDKQVIGSAVQTAANLIPVGKTSSLATKGLAKVGLGKVAAGVGGKVIAGAATGYAFDVGTGLQNKDKITGEAFKPGVGTIVGGALPVAGLLAKKLILEPLGKVSKGIASGLSGTSTNTLDDILTNPQKAEEISNTIKTQGADKVLQDQVNEYMGGVSKLRKEASKAFGDGLEKLSETDIKPKVFRDNTQAFFDNNGIFSENGKLNLSNLEFSEKGNVTKATNAIKELNNMNLDGKSLRSFVDRLSKPTSEGGLLYKTATTDERIAFNSFMKDLASTVRSAITQSTDKLGEINAQYSKDIGLADAIQNIYGDVKFKNLEEVNKIAKKIERQNLTGLDEKTVNDFFSRLGKSSQDFKTASATREISTKVSQRNPEGLNISEIIRSITAGILTPKLVRDTAILVGKTEPQVRKILSSSGSELAKKALLNSLSNLRKQ